MLQDTAPAGAWLTRQLSANARLNLLARDMPRRARVVPGLERALAVRSGPAVRSLARRTADAVADRVQEINQYIHVDLSGRRALASIYEESWHLMRGRDGARRPAQELLREVHLPRVGAWAAGLYPESLRTALAQQDTVQAVPCFEYSAALQIELLRLSAADLRGPLLDVGCGASGTLVRHLRASGADAHGCDRFATPGDGITRCDWFDFPYGQQSWQCIVAHLSLGNHWTHAQLHTPSGPPRWRALLCTMLDALRPGGSLVVAPAPRSLIEAVPPGYAVRLWPVHSGLAAVRITRGPA